MPQDTWPSLAVFIARTLEAKNRQFVFVLGPVANVEAIRAVTGMDAGGYVRVVDNYGLRHALRSHGDPVAERKRGQVAIIPEDLALVPGITSMPDQLQDGGKTRQGRQVILSIGRASGHVLTVAEELRPGRKQIALLSMWKRSAT